MGSTTATNEVGGPDGNFKQEEPVALWSVQAVVCWLGTSGRSPHQYLSMTVIDFEFLSFVSADEQLYIDCLCCRVPLDPNTKPSRRHATPKVVPVKTTNTKTRVIALIARCGRALYEHHTTPPTSMERERKGAAPKPLHTSPRRVSSPPPSTSLPAKLCRCLAHLTPEAQLLVSLDNKSHQRRTTRETAATPILRPFEHPTTRNNRGRLTTPPHCMRPKLPSSQPKARITSDRGGAQAFKIKLPAQRWAIVPTAGED